VGIGLSVLALALVANVVWRARGQGGHAWTSRSVLLVLSGVVTWHGLWEWADRALPFGIVVTGLTLGLRFVDRGTPTS
jgi:hypothetical protein